VAKVAVVASLRSWVSARGLAPEYAEDIASAFDQAQFPVGEWMSVLEGMAGDECDEFLRSVESERAKRVGLSADQGVAEPGYVAAVDQARDSSGFFDSAKSAARLEIEGLYQKHNPEKLPEVAALAEKYGEARLLKMIQKKYGVELKAVRTTILVPRAPTGDGQSKPVSKLRSRARSTP
jgi:hypothetical protein